ncbi:hypothetical protein DFJ67_1201 [Asanoa ferruginea]|uniref:Uncharacterized protein n=1 Tax=Asanoa ferruginea TaxID=53367 RepID=A0A3D9ZCV7_9ACTN|nr:hypothetical protein [Asanoa ferruginea]REF95248.1 hypothetical protein DFJ67_1201 [Asanoa ferruginea]GIF48334.1 hypothetical protein Afe04nite_28730 [Asanoa ferruginea]
MMIEDKLSGLMHERADRPVDADALLAGALAAGRARKRRRHAAYAVVSAGVAGVVAASLLVNTGGGGPAVVTGDGSGNGPTSWDTVPVLPAVYGELGAAARPDLVGEDPTVLRFAVPWAPLPVQAVGWTSHDGVEQIDVQMMSGDVQVSGRVSMWRGADRGQSDNASVPNKSSTVEIDGHPANLEQEQFDWGPNQWLSWHPAEDVTVEVSLVASGFVGSVDGTSTQATVVGVDELKAFASAVRLDTTTACSAPFRLSVVPSGGQLLNCSGSVMAVGPGHGIRNGSLLFSNGTRLVEVDYRTLTGDPAETAEPATDSPDPIPTAPATTDPTSSGSPGSPNSPSPLVDPTVQPPVPTGVTATEESGRLTSTDQTPVRKLGPGMGAWVAYQPGGETEASAVVAGLVPAGDPDDPTTWPRSPIG